MVLRKTKRERFAERFKTLKGVFDSATERALFKLASQGYIQAIESPISIGKEANIFTALTPAGERVVIKVYRVMACDFRKMRSLLSSDPRFFGIGKSRKGIVRTWAQREYRNLLAAKEAGCAAPRPIALLENVLVMSYIGRPEGPAPKLRDAEPENPKEFFELLLESIRRLYKAGLVHGDLSPYNILNLDSKPYIIDWSQATPLKNPNAAAWLARDISNLCSFFSRFGLKLDPNEVLKKLEEI